jgi:nicotinamidase-related amidase
MNDKPKRLARDQTGLLVVDVQERLLPTIHERERLVKNVRTLAQGAALLKVPVLVSEQYRKGLGPTTPQIVETIPGFAPFEKIAFSACGAAGLPEALAARNIANVLLCGMETHVCVLQTCLDLIERGLNVFVVADAVSSRSAQNYELGLARMREAGAVIASTEMVLFELMERAGTEEFKAVQALIK